MRAGVDPAPGPRRGAFARVSLASRSHCERFLSSRIACGGSALRAFTPRISHLPRRRTLRPMLAALAALVPASTAPWACAALQSFECPEVDEMRQEPGCQVRCRGASCPHGRDVCRKIRGCDDFAVNDERTWATLKQRRTRRAKVELECPNHDELPDEPGCQLACRGTPKVRPRARHVQARAAVRRRRAQRRAHVGDAQAAGRQHVGGGGGGRRRPPAASLAGRRAVVRAGAGAGAPRRPLRGRVVAVRRRRRHGAEPGGDGPLHRPTDRLAARARAVGRRLAA